MKAKFSDLIDIERVNTLLENFNQLTGFVTAILDLEGNVISKSEWRHLCTAYHRTHPETAMRCTVSDTLLAGKMAAGEKYHCYKCLNGLVDVAVPIKINGEHVANLFSGQLFLEEPDKAFFKNQAIQYGFDDAYLEAVGKIPVMSEESVRRTMEFLLNMTWLISDLAYQKMELADDIICRKQAEEKQAESEKKYRSILQIAPVGIAIHQRGKIVFANPACISLIGCLSMEQLIGRNVEDFILPENLEASRKRIQRLKAGEQGLYPVEDRFKRLDGVIIDVEVSDSLTTFNEEPAIQVIVTDITEKKRVREKLRQLNAELELKVAQRTAQLEASVKELEAFSYSVSHDLRAPLRHINGYVDLLIEKFQDALPEKGRHYLETVASSSRQMGTLIDDLIRFSRIGKQEVQQSEFEMNTLVQEVLHKMRPDYESRPINWHIGALPCVSGDYSLLTQVWVNLIDNALKYTRKKNPAEIFIGFRDEPDYDVFFIHDNGVGFDMAYASKLFGVFQRLHSQVDFEGTGIGLAHMQRIVHKHNGKVWAEAEPGNGAAFFFSLPKINQ